MCHGQVSVWNRQTGITKNLGVNMLQHVSVIPRNCICSSEWIVAIERDYFGMHTHGDHKFIT